MRGSRLPAQRCVQHPSHRFVVFTGSQKEELQSVRIERGGRLKPGNSWKNSRAFLYKQNQQNSNWKRMMMMRECGGMFCRGSGEVSFFPSALPRAIWGIWSVGATWRLLNPSSWLFGPCLEGGVLTTGPISPKGLLPGEASVCNCPCTLCRSNPRRFYLGISNGLSY